MDIIINPEIKYQTFESFGVSGAWWAQIVGDWNHIDTESGKQVRNRISELLFNKSEGIGLNIYRYNIGAGSKHSRKGEYSMPARSTECFEISKGKYDWNRDKNAVYMMKQAVKDGVDEVILFVNSPPERLTENGMAHADKGKIFKENISKKNYREFANYCLDIAEHFIEEGIPVKFLSPVNEPVWIWNGGQEGCHYKPHSVRKVFEVFAEELSKRPSLKRLKLSGAESGDLRWFNKTYTRNLLKSEKVRNVLDAVDVHSYCLPIPLPFNVPILNNRLGFIKRFRKWMNKRYPDIPVKMSEWCHMKGGRDKTISSALVMARTIYEDITLLNVTSWQHWIAVSEVDYCDGLIYINLDDKTFEMTKRYYATGNFSRYISPGSVRIDTKCNDNDLLSLAFLNDGKIILVLINLSYDYKEINLATDKAVKHIITDKDKDLFETIATNSISLTPESVNTIIYEI